MFFHGKHDNIWLAGIGMLSQNPDCFQQKFFFFLIAWNDYYMKNRELWILRRFFPLLVLFGYFFELVDSDHAWYTYSESLEKRVANNDKAVYLVSIGEEERASDHEYPAADIDGRHKEFPFENAIKILSFSLHNHFNFSDVVN